MDKMAMVKQILGLALIGMMPSSITTVARGTAGAKAALFPKACFFFIPDPSYRPGPNQLREERSYDAALSEVYRAWCTASRSGPEARKKSAEALVAAWKAVWERDNPTNASFYETSTSDLLALLALTHELPDEMVRDPAFTKKWVEACTGTCFTIWSVPTNRKEEHGVAMQLWLRNDVLDHLKEEPASEPVLKMLQEAQFRLVD